MLQPVLLLHALAARKSVPFDLLEVFLTPAQQFQHQGHLEQIFVID